MKAKEYAARYLADETDEALYAVGRDMILETKTLIENRHAKTDAALLSILDELNTKWKTFVRLVGDPSIRPDGFMRFIEHEMPEIYTLLRNRGWKG